VLVLVLCCLIALGTGCSSSSEVQPALNGSSWTLTGWGEPEPIPSDVRITAEFADDRVAGQAGVNRYSAGVTSNGDGAFGVQAPITTKMAGPPEAMAAEQAYLRRLEDATAYRVDGNTLVLHDGEGQTSLTFTRAA